MLRRTRRRSALPRRLRIRAKNFLLNFLLQHYSFFCPRSSFGFGLATWVQPFHPASPRPSSVPGANLVLTHGLLFFLPLSAIYTKYTRDTIDNSFPRRYSTPVLAPWPLVRTVWLAGSTGSALPTPSDAPLLVAGPSTLATFRQRYEHVNSVCVCFLPFHSGHQVRWTYQPGSHRRKVTQDFSSTFFLRCVP